MEVLDSPIGQLGIRFDVDAVAGLTFISAIYQDKPNRELSHPLAEEVRDQLKAYFYDPKTTFSLPLKVRGTPLQKKIWRALCEIPVGSRVTYGELAEKLNTHPRIIGNACRANPTPVLVPCHRVVAKSGLGGFSGAVEGEKLDIKRWLLDHEMSGA